MRRCMRWCCNLRRARSSESAHLANGTRQTYDTEAPPPVEASVELSSSSEHTSSGRSATSGDDKSTEASGLTPSIVSEDVIAEQSSPISKALVELGMPEWALEQTITLCKPGEESKFEGKAVLLDRSVCTSVTSAVELLNTGRIECAIGICIVFSARQQMYHVLYRADRKSEAFHIFGFSQGPEPPVTPDRSVFKRLQTFVLDRFGPGQAAFDPSKLIITRNVALEERYNIVSELGAGVQGKTFEVRRKGLGTAFVAKVTTNVSNKGSSEFKNEFEKMRDLRHPNCVKVVELLEDPAQNSLCIISELAHGGDLYKYMEVVAEHGGLNEKLVSGLFYQAMSGVAFLHSSDCVHNDLKPDNILVMDSYSPLKTPRVVISDYGCATFLRGNKVLFGDPRYQAPENLRQLAMFVKDPQADVQPGDTKGDIWSMGVTLYELLSGGVLPFLYRRCPRSPTSWNDDIWVELRKVLLNDEEVDIRSHCEFVSPQEEGLLRRLLTKTASSRPSAQAILQGDFFAAREVTKDSSDSDLCLTASTNRARQILLNAIARNLESTHQKKCHRIFDRFDTDHAGTINRDKFKSALASLGQSNLLERADEIFDSADVTKTGRLEFNEFVALTYDWRSADAKMLDDLLEDFLASLGASKDGVISTAGLSDFFKGMLTSSELEALLQSGRTVSEMRDFVAQASFTESSR